jgi:hypothetical protein
VVDEEVFERRPVHWGERLPIVHVVTSMIAENVHHIAEVGALRDIRRGAARSQPFPDRVGPPWWLGESPDSA